MEYLGGGSALDLVSARYIQYVLDMKQRLIKKIKNWILVDSVRFTCIFFRFLKTKSLISINFAQIKSFIFFSNFANSLKQILVFR